MLKTIWILALLLCSPQEGCFVVPVMEFTHQDLCRGAESRLEERYPHVEFICIIPEQDI